MYSLTAAGAMTRATFRKADDTPLVRSAHAVLLVSVGQRYHEGEKLRATIDLINTSEFGYCTIAVCDTLQRHNLTRPGAHRVARALGDEWLSRNVETIRRLNMGHEILRWDDVLRLPDYPRLRELVERTYESDAGYRAAVNATIERFLDRLSKRKGNLDRSDTLARCLAYLLEECPFMPMWAAQGYDYIVYPQQMTEAMGMTREKFVAPQHPGKANWLWLRFKKRRVAAAA